MNKNLFLEDIISDKEKESIISSLLLHIQTNSFKEPSLVLNSLQYTKHICQNPECMYLSNQDVFNKKLILSHALSANWIFRDKDIDYKPLYTLYTDYTNFPDCDFEEQDILSIFYKNSDITTESWGKFSEYKKQFIENYEKYIPSKFYYNIFENFHVQSQNCFQFYIFSNYKKYCGKCDKKLFESIDKDKSTIIDESFFSNITKKNETRKLLLERFQDYFNYRNDNKIYILQENINRINEEEKKTLKIKEFDFFNQQIKKLNKLKEALTINMEAENSKVHSCMDVIFSNLISKSALLKSFFYNSNLGIKNCCAYLINTIDYILLNRTNFLISSYNESMQMMSDIRSIYKKSYISILENHVKQENSLLQKNVSQMDVIYCEKEKKADFFGFSYFNLNNILQFINENIPESHKIMIDINKDDGGYCFLTPMKDEKTNSFYVFSDKKTKDKIELIVLDLTFLLNNKYKKDELLSVFYYSTFLWESENLCIYSKEKKHLEEIKKFLKIIKSQDENKIENLIKFFRETSINK